MARAFSQIVPSISNPRWAADFMEPRTRSIAPFPAKLDPALFTDRSAVQVVLTASPLINATTITVTPVVFPGGATAHDYGIASIYPGTVLDFGSDYIAVVSQQYTGGATIHVQPLPQALTSGMSATFSPFFPRLAIASGTLVSRSYAGYLANGLFRPATLGDFEIYLTAYDCVDLNLNNNVEFYNHGLGVKANYLPTWSTAYTLANEVQAFTVTGAASAGEFVLDFGNGTSVTFAYNASLATVQALLDTMFGATNTVASGTPPNISIAFQNALAGLPQAQMRLGIGAATGPTKVVSSRTTDGGNDLLTMLQANYKVITGAN